MTRHGLVRIATWLLLFALSGSPYPAPKSAPAMTERSSAAALTEHSPAAAPSAEPATSSSPTVIVHGGSDAQRARLTLAMARFAALDLPLPDLDVYFLDRYFLDRDACGGHLALYEGHLSPPRISICSQNESVYEHELAHAWEATSLDDITRQAFMELRGYSIWYDRDVPWNERAIEGVALVVQQGLAGLPLPASLGDELCSRMEAFELLTGRVDTRMADWEHRTEGLNLASCS